MSNRKEEILIAALNLFARDGYEAVSVSQIAGRRMIKRECLKSMRRCHWMIL